jgi:integrase
LPRARLRYCPPLSEYFKERPVWDKEQLLAFLTAVGNDRLFAFWRLLAMTGARRGEALGLRWEDIDIEAGTITIRRSLIAVNGELYLSDPKTKRGNRTIALDAVTLEALKSHAAHQADERAEWDEAWVDSGYVFTRENGEALHPYAISKMFRELVKAAALPAIPLHSLRHTYATLALSSGVNPRIVSGRLGHSTVALTLDIYSHVLPQADAEAASQIAALLETSD